ncbi:PREDICTED: uncharacterized protein LOC109158988 [Ipomoea nil]|uniref:uncharacterized protein LOC109158988 n=1 Tax=Ipomoea nil TaxID=35883 RepID=UPI00090149C3|nr:PREDICTED: uncharacterized protein LOC109158988 [Ipomoea nil]
MDDETMLITSTVEKQKKRRRHSSKNPKRKQQQQQQLKVVYISNPVRVNTSAAKFRALVQELTGQDADDLPVTPHAAATGGGRQGSCVQAMEDHVVLQVPTTSIHHHHHHHPGTTDTSSENSNLIFEDSYVPQLQESFPAGILPSNIWYESI